MTEATQRAKINSPFPLRASPLPTQMTQNEPPNGLSGEGVIEVLPDGFGFLRDPEHSFLPGSDDVYVSPSQIRRFSLRNGDCVRGVVRQPKENERYLALIKVEAINGQDPDEARAKLAFEELTPLHATEAYSLETEGITSRVIELAAPLGRGQRGLIFAPPRSGRTHLLTSLMDALAANHPAAERILLLVGARPEDLEEVFATTNAQVLGTSFDEPAQRHVSVADMALSRAQRLVEHGRDVVLFVDSLNALCRAHNHIAAGGGKTLPGGLEPAALVDAKRLLGAARNVEEGGSLTVVGSMLVGTGSRLDEVVAEEFAGTGTWELHLDEELASRRLFPALDLARSANHRLTQVVGQDHADRLFALRDAIGSAGTPELRRRVAATRDNEALLRTLDKLAAAGN